MLISNYEERHHLTHRLIELDHPGVIPTSTLSIVTGEREPEKERRRGEKEREK